MGLRTNVSISEARAAFGEIWHASEDQLIQPPHTNLHCGLNYFVTRRFAKWYLPVVSLGRVKSQLTVAGE